ncbi:MAG: ORF6N domain-containing protein [Verrucomicrobiota bacterium]
MNDKASLIQPEQIEQVILLIRGQRVMLDRDLAALYGVTTGNLNKAVQRNPERFPPDFMFQLTAEEAEALSFHFGSLKRGQHFKYLPRVFTQEGVSMLSHQGRQRSLPREKKVTMPNEFQYDVFLSHSAKDKAVVRPLAERLRKDGLRVWFDEWALKPGDSIPAKIEEGLEPSDFGFRISDLRSLACRRMRSARTGRSCG